MHKSRPTIFLTTILCILLQTVSLLPAAYANVSQIQFENLSRSEGLSHYGVRDIIEDDIGFMWFATIEGLSRYDGYEFVNYHSKKDDPTSLPNNLVRTLFIDSKSRMWVGTENGLAMYDKENDNFIRYDKHNSGLKGNIIWAISETTDGKVLVNDGFSLFRYAESTNKFVNFIRTPPLSHLEVRVIFSEDDKVWLGTYDGGVNIIDSSGELHDLRKPNRWNFDISANSIHDIKKSNNDYWFATSEGVLVFNDSGILLNHYSTKTQPAIIHDIVTTIVHTSNGKTWLGTADGISVLNQSQNEVTNIDSSNAKIARLKDRTIWSSFEDSNNTIWFGTMSKGLHKHHLDGNKIRHFVHVPDNPSSLSNDMVWSLNEDSKGSIWVALQSGGINEIARESLSVTRHLVDFDYAVFDLTVDNNDNIWIGTTNGLYAFARGESGLQQIAHLIENSSPYGIKYFDGIIYADTGNGAILAVSTSDFSTELIRSPNPSISNIAPLNLDSSRNLWVNTDLGLAYFNLDSKQFNQLILERKTENTFFVDVYEKNNLYWVVTSDNGIFKIDKQSFNVVDHIDDLEGLSDTTVLSSVLLENAIWIGSTGSVFEVNIDEEKVDSVISSAMLNHNSLNQDSVYATQDGHLLFGGSEGFHMFSRQQITQAIKYGEKLSAPTVIGLSIYNKPITKIGNGSPLEKPVYLSDKLTLNNDHSPFSLKFAQINPVSTKNIEYQYKIEELNEHWLSADARTRDATYTNLSFGSYNFYVQNRTVNGDWSEPSHLTLVIKPPLWLHRNAIVLYGFFLFLMLAYWFKQYKTRRASQIAIQESEERLKLTLWSSGDELWDWDIYRGQVFRANTWGTLDFPQDNIRANSSYQANIHADDIPKVQNALNKHMKDDTDHFQVTYRAKTFKGEWIWLLDRGKVVRRDSNNQPLRMTGTLKNISHLKQAEEQLKLFKRSIETISDGVFIADTTFKFISVNQSYCDYTGETREQALASYLTFHQYPEAFTDEVKKSLQHKSNWFGEVESRRANGDKYEMELNIDAVQGEDGKISHYVGVFSDITSRKSTEKELLKLANTDPLTEMPNRSFFQASHGNLVRKNAHHALICLDMDNFKKINDSLGHQTGDILIKQIGKRLQKISGISSTCYRLGGDEFSILIDNTTDMHRITHFAQRILDDMARPFLINKQEFVLGASVGIAFYPEDGSSPQELLKNADTAMYFAKNAGGNKYQFFSGEMNQNAVRQLQIENLIRHGLKEDLFTVFYQPKVDIASGKLVSMEALVRFEHPEKGIVSPSQFIPLAEETGQIIEIGERVMQKACEDTKRWVQQGLFTGRVAVNISARQFELPDLDDKINAILQKVGLSALHLECEITEGTLMQNPDQALRMMERLRERGIHLALDDFGTGYSSLAYLKKFPLNTLKIDKAFIDDIATSSVDKHMTAAIINIAHNLGLKVVAEGVEQEKQLSILRRYDCEMLQGYLYSKPLSSARFERLLKENLQLTQLMKSPS